jgi:hypothetical protein
MPLRINGHEIPWTGLTSVCVGIFWLAGLSFQVASNADEIDKQQETRERLVRIEERQESVKEDIKEIKESQKDTKDTLKIILTEVTRRDPE